MFDQRYQDTLDGNSPATQSVNSGLAVTLATGREMKELTTRADKISNATSLVKYDFSSVVQEIEYLKKSFPGLNLSEQDTQLIAKLGLSKDSPTAADIKALTEITDRLIQNNPNLPGSDGAWLKASTTRLSEQQQILTELGNQSLEFRRTEALKVRTIAIDELRTDLPADKVADIDKAFPDKTSKEAVQKLIELAAERKKELQDSFNAEDKKTLERINLSLNAISKSEKEISDCNAALPSDRQQGAGRDERSWYQSKLAETLVKDILPLLNPTEAGKIDLSKITDPSEQLATALNVVRSSMKEFLSTDKGKAWIEQLPADYKTALRNFVASSNANIGSKESDLIAAFSQLATEGKALTGGEKQRFEAGLENLQRTALDYETHKRYLPDGIPIPGATGESATAYTNTVREQFKKIDQEFWGEMKNSFLNLAKDNPAYFKSPDGKSLQEISNAMEASGSSPEEIGKALWRTVKKLAPDAAVSLDANTYSDIRGMFNANININNPSTLTEFNLKVVRIVERRDSLAEQTGIGEKIIGRSDDDKLASRREDEFNYYLTEQSKGFEKLLGLFAPDKLNEIKASGITSPDKLLQLELKVVVDLAKAFLTTSEGKDFYSKQNGFIKSQIDGINGNPFTLTYDSAFPLALVLNAMIDKDTKLTSEQRISARQTVVELKQIGLEVSVQHKGLYSGTPNSNPQTQVERDYINSLPSYLTGMQSDVWTKFSEEIRKLDNSPENRLGLGSRIEDTVKTMKAAGKSENEVGQAIYRIIAGLPENAPVTLDAKTFNDMLLKLDNSYQKVIAATNDPTKKATLLFAASSIQYELTKITEIHDSFVDLAQLNAAKILAR